MYRFVLAFVGTLALTGCRSPEKDAADVALAYASAGLDQPGGAYDLACADEQTAKSRAAYLADFDSLKELMGPKWDESIANSTKIRWTVKATNLDTEKSQGSVDVAATRANEGAEPEENVTRVIVRLDGEAWCVVTGWAETARLDAVAEEVQALVKQSMDATDAWVLDQAEAKVAAAEAKLSEIPEDYIGRSLASTSVSLQRDLLKLMMDGWVGGRWRVSEEMDPMTDQKNVVLNLQSASKMPNSIGEEKAAVLIVRCNRGKLDVFVSTPSILDSNWRYDSVAGQHRFGGSEAQKLSGSVSTDHKAVFLKNPKWWLSQLAAHETDGWTVELPLYNRLPAAVRFDLTATSKALAALPEGCK